MAPSTKNSVGNSKVTTPSDTSMADQNSRPNGRKAPVHDEDSVMVSLSAFRMVPFKILFLSAREYTTSILLTLIYKYIYIY